MYAYLNSVKKGTRRVVWSFGKIRINTFDCYIYIMWNFLSTTIAKAYLNFFFFNKLRWSKFLGGKRMGVYLFWSACDEDPECLAEEAGEEGVEAALPVQKAVHLVQQGHVRGQFLIDLPHIRNNISNIYSISFQ